MTDQSLLQKAGPATLNDPAEETPATIEFSQLVALFNTRHYVELENWARLLVEQHPDSAFAWKALGASLQMQGKDALPALQKAAELLPDDAESHNNLGVALRNSGQLDNAAASYRHALEINPDYAEAYNNLGNVLRDLGQFNGAAASYSRMLEIRPDYAEAHNNLGNVLQDLGQFNGAAASYRRALEIKPDYAEAHNNLGVVLRDLGQFDSAMANYRRALEINPDYAEAYSNLGVTLQDLGQFDSAMANYRRALEIKPDYTEAHNNLGNALRDLGQFDDAVASYRRALEIKPDYAEAHNNLGVALQDLGQFDHAAASYRRALEIKPGYAEAHSNLGVTLQDLGQFDHAAASYRRALEIKPGYAEAHSNLLFCLSHNAGISPDTLFAEHCLFAKQFELPLRDRWPKHANLRNPERCLQIGFVSGDLHHHAVANFIEPVLAQLARHPRLSLHAYYNHTIEDGVTQRLRGYVSRWHPIAGLPDAVLAEKIRNDGIDILVDLSGHTAKHRLLTFARKPAPVQASWIGYPGTTGLGAMDYYLADRYFLPPGEFDSQFTEKIAYLPATVPFLPSEHAPPVSTLPAVSNGYMTFGSFNRPGKLSPSVISLWSQLLRALPDSRMLLGAMPQCGKYNALIEWFAREGIERERLDIHPRCGVGTYLSLHQQVDICLDTFPYTGGTTTNHALWMGVPTLTLAGNTAPSRQGTAILTRVGLEDFVARDTTDFVEKGLYWSSNLSGLTNVRAGLREHWRQSPIRQPEIIAAGVERALRVMWQRWCAGLPAESFTACPQDIGNLPGWVKPWYKKK